MRLWPSSWAVWTAIERANFLAQIATICGFVISACAFLASSVFAYLTWNEASLARAEQKQYFIAEKSPILEVSAQEFIPNVNGDAMGILFEIKNKGSSPAADVSVILKYPITDKDDDVALINADCDKNKIPKDKYIACNFKFDRNALSIEGMELVEVAVDMDKNNYNEPIMMKIIDIDIKFKDMYGEQHSDDTALILKYRIKDKKNIKPPTR